MPTSTVEDYLKTLYQHQPKDAQLLAMGKLATAMNVAPGTATSMVKALAESSLVLYEPRTGVRLSPSGQRLALHVLRRHRLIELFLVKVLGFDWAQVHDEADRLEHAVSDKVLTRIDDLLGNPSVDPHGDPIPTSKGKIIAPNLRSLAKSPLDQPVRITRIVDQDPNFLRFVDSAGLTPGTDAVVKHKNSDADSVTIHPAKTPPITLGSAAAAKILVDPTP